MKIESNYHDKQRSFVLFLLNETLNIVFAHYGSQTLTNYQKVPAILAHWLAEGTLACYPLQRIETSQKFIHYYE
jgi:hypothetical protein